MGNRSQYRIDQLCEDGVWRCAECKKGIGWRV